MTDPLVVVVLLGAAADPTAEGMVTATRGALGPDALVLADTSNVTSDREALAIGQRVQARAVVRISWENGSFEHARLHVHVVPSDAWADEDLAFSPNDSASEKGRTVGFTLASMVQRLEQAHAEHAAVTVPVVAPPIVLARPPSPPAEAPPHPATPARWEAFGAGTGLVGGAAAGGGTGGLRWTSRRGVGARAAVGGVTGSLGGADANVTALFLAIGPTFGVMLADAFEVGARADLLVMDLSVSRAASTRDRWLGAAGLMAEAGVRLGSRVMATAAVGPQLAFGSTSVRVGGVEAAEVPRWRGAAELGVRIRF